MTLNILEAEPSLSKLEQHGREQQSYGSDTATNACRLVARGTWSDLGTILHAPVLGHSLSILVLNCLAHEPLLLRLQRHWLRQVNFLLLFLFLLFAFFFFAFTFFGLLLLFLFGLLLLLAFLFGFGFLGLLFLLFGLAASQLDCKVPQEVLVKCLCGHCATLHGVGGKGGLD